MGKIGSAMMFLLFAIGGGRTAAAEQLELRYYSADWCAPCHLIGPMVAEWAAEQPGLSLVRLDYDKSQADRLRYGFSGVPVLILLADGKFVASYGMAVERISDFADNRLDRWFAESRSLLIATAP